jgi:hypothetical protein
VSYQTKACIEPCQQRDIPRVPSLRAGAVADHSVHRAVVLSVSLCLCVSALFAPVPLSMVDSAGSRHIMPSSRRTMPYHATCHATALPRTLADQVNSHLRFMQNQAPGCFHLSYLLSLYWEIVPFLHRHLMPMTQGVVAAM